ncbi:MAG: hypothetical protein RLZZ05_1109, partial [Bacteroidota bacterium]
NTSLFYFYPNPDWVKYLTKRSKKLFDG